MSQPWEIYDALLDGLPGDVVVRAAGQGPRWSRVLNSAGGVGAAWTMDVRSRPALAEGPLEDRPLRDVAALVKSWNLAEAALATAEEYICLERNLQPGDWPDSACEYVLPECDFVFISSSSFVNKTAPRLIELSRHVHTVLVGPSTPLNPVLFDAGVDTITGFVAARSLSEPAALAELIPAGDIGPGFRVHRHRP